MYADLLSATSRESFVVSLASCDENRGSQHLEPRVFNCPVAPAYNSQA
jgi:hypothetical protein